MRKIPLVLLPLSIFLFSLSLYAQDLPRVENFTPQGTVKNVRQVFMGRSGVRPQTTLAPHLAGQLLKDRPAGSGLACSLDGETQRFATDRLEHHLLQLLPQNVHDGAILVVENRTGEVLAYASHSGEPSLSRFVDGVTAKRQAGSTLKPFLYALAFDQRILTPASLLDGSPLDVPVFGGIYHPQNYESLYQGLVPVRAALGSSLNVPAVRALSLVGLEPFLNKLRALGIGGLDESGDFYGPALALGSVDVSLWELVNAYRALANGGQWCEAHFAAGESRWPPPKASLFCGSGFPGLRHPFGPGSPVDHFRPGESAGHPFLDRG